MRKSLTALVTAATIAVAAVAAPSAAEARWGWGGPGFFLGGLAAGALVGAALAPNYYYGYPGYYGYPAYYGGYGYSPYYSCWRRHWNGRGWVRYRVC
jgi:hypothetical protein